jgi:hypothetical protein
LRSWSFGSKSLDKIDILNIGVCGGKRLSDIAHSISLTFACDKRKI